MKKSIFFFSIFMMGFVYSQISFSPNPWGTFSGYVTVSYGPDYSEWDPMGETTIFMYSGLETLNDPGQTWDYHDDWAEPYSMVELNLDTSTGIYTGSINLSTHSYIEEANPSNVGPIVSGTTVYEFYFLFRNMAGTSQSGDLLGSNYGFQESTMGSEDLSTLPSQNLKVVQGKLFIPDANLKSVQIYDVNGRWVKELKTNGLNAVDLNLTKGLYFIITDDQQKIKCIIP